MEREDVRTRVLGVLEECGIIDIPKDGDEVIKEIDGDAFYSISFFLDKFFKEEFPKGILTIGELQDWGSFNTLNKLIDRVKARIINVI